MVSSALFNKTNMIQMTASVWLRLNVWCIIIKIKACYSKEVRRVRKYQSGNQNQYKLGYMRGLVFNYMWQTLALPHH